MSNATTREHEVKPEVSEEENRKLAAKAAEEAAERAADQARFDALFGWEDENRRRANLTLAEQPRFNAIVLATKASFGAMTHAEREAYLTAQEAMTPEQRAEVNPLHTFDELLAELTYIKICNLPIPDALYNNLVAIVKTVNADTPPVADPASRSAHERQVIKDEAEAEKRARGR